MSRHPVHQYGPDHPHRPLRHQADFVAIDEGEHRTPRLIIWTRLTLHPAQFVAVAAAAMTLVFGIVWLWILTMPMAFLDPEYPAWRARLDLLADCELGELIVLGDSRAAAGMMPTVWRTHATNLAVGGGEPIEALAALTRALRCPFPPRRVILSFDAVHFTETDLFWERTARFGFLDASEIATLRDVSRELRDESIYELRHTDGLPSRLRDAMFEARFPSLYFSSLMKGGLMLRWARNRNTYAAAAAARGQYFFGTQRGSSVVAADGHIRDFRPLPVLEWYFDRILRTLHDRGIPAVFVAVPMNDATARAVAPGTRERFRSWLTIYEARYPGFRVAGDVMPYWPNRWFGDGFAHLNPAGARFFSLGLGSCLDDATDIGTCVQRLQDAPPSTQNDAQ
jgi:hypothetical protein